MKRIVLPVVAATMMLSSCKSDGRTLKPASPDQSLSIVVPTTIPPESTAAPAAVETVEAVNVLPSETPATGLNLSGRWLNGGILPPDSTCKGKGLSPELTWTNIPADATELVLTVTDADATGFVHWILAGIDPATPGLAQGRVPRGTVQALNSSPAVGWTAPCPPQGTHRYIFSLYVLTKPSGILSGMESEAALAGLTTPGIPHVAITGTVTA